MEKIEQIILRTMAEIALAIADNPSLPAQLAIAAAERCPGHLFLPNEIATLEYERRGLGDMNCWFFAFAHELGHFQPMEITETWRDLAQSTLIYHIESLHAVQKSYRDEIIAKIRAGRTGSLLDTGQIVTEALADAYAMIILFESALAVMEKAGQLEQFSIEGFYHKAILSLNIVATFAEIEKLILARRYGIADAETILEQGFHKQAIGARCNVALGMFQDYLQEQYPDDEDFSLDHQREILNEAARRFKQDIVAWDQGFAAAMKTLFGLQLPCDISHFLGRLNALPADTFELGHLNHLAKAAEKVLMVHSSNRTQAGRPER